MSRPRKNPEFVEKKCPTCQSIYVISYRKKHQVYCSKSCAQQNPATKSKMVISQKTTYLNNYGVEHPMKTAKVVDNFKNSMVRKYGVTSALKSSTFFEKSKATKLGKYGDEHFNNRSQANQTCMERYGVDNIRKVKSVVDEVSSTRRLNHYSFLVDHCSKTGLQFMCSADDYNGYHFSHKYEFKCTVCEKKFESTVYNLNKLFCDYCHPEKINDVENRMYTFLQSITGKEEIIIRNDRTVLVGKELDFYIPSKKLAIEMNGLYWHSEHGGGRLSYYHLNKTKACMFHGLSLMHVFENEWSNKEEIVKSIIRTVVGMSERRIFARECEVLEVPNHDKNDFLLKNHLQGEDKSTVKLGLYYDDELVSLMTFRKGSRFEKNVEWELTRFCNKLNTSIVGGASKLFSSFLKSHSPKMIVSYCDRRYFTGNVYDLLGFKFVKNTPPGYYVTVNNYKDLKNRMSFQKHKLEKILKVYDKNISSWQNLINNGYDRIWDCGHSKWIFSK